jgi:hypothetical protein
MNRSDWALKHPFLWACFVGGLAALAMFICGYLQHLGY